MQEMLYPTSYLKSMKLDKQCALLTDGRFSGGTSGLSIGHVSPEAAAGGLIGLVKDGDIIKIDITSRSIEVEVSEEELVSETVTPAPAESATAPLLKRVEIFLEDENWAKADEYCEKVLDLEPENGKAYLGKLLAEMKLRNSAALKEQTKSFEDRDNCQKALRYGDETVVSTIEAALTQIRTRKMQAGMARKKLAAERAEKLKKLGRKIGIGIAALAALGALIWVVILIAKNATKTQPPETLSGTKQTSFDAASQNIPEQSIVSTTTIPESTLEDLSYQVGDTILFGKYEQDNNLENGPELIEWIVLDVQEGRALLISRYSLDSFPHSTQAPDATWETGIVRSWLNDVFFNTAFSESERSKIPTVSLSTGGHPVIPFETQDKIFLLSFSEAKRYFLHDSDRICEATPYAVSRNVLVDNAGNCFWYLRSPGPTTRNLACVTFKGYIDAAHREIPILAYAGVRPALWVDLES